MYEFKPTQFVKITNALNEALAQIIKDFDPKTVLAVLQNNGDKVVQYVRLMLTALIMNQELVLATGNETESKPSLLNLVATAALEAVERFVAKDHFKEGTTKGVKIAWLGDNFKKHFLKKIEDNVAEATLRIFTLAQASLDPPIITGLGDNHETFLAQLWAMLALQPNGEAGKLLTNGYANVFYIRDDEGILWAVDARWLSVGWYVEAYSVEYPRRWHAGYQVVGR